MSWLSSDSSSICSASSVGYPVPGDSTDRKTTPPLYNGRFDDDEDSLSESSSVTSLIDLQSHQIFENIDSDCDAYNTDNSCQDFSVKDWLKLARAIVIKHVGAQEKHKLVEKYDEIQEFFYFFAVEYFSMEDKFEELVQNKKQEFICTWEDILGTYNCQWIFDFLVDLMDEINAESSFRLSSSF